MGGWQPNDSVFGRGNGTPICFEAFVFRGASKRKCGQRLHLENQIEAPLTSSQYRLDFGENEWILPAILNPTGIYDSSGMGFIPTGSLKTISRNLEIFKKQKPE